MWFVGNTSRSLFWECPLWIWGVEDWAICTAFRANAHYFASVGSLQVHLSVQALDPPHTEQALAEDDSDTAAAAGAERKAALTLLKM